MAQVTINPSAGDGEAGSWDAAGTDWASCQSGSNLVVLPTSATARAVVDIGADFTNDTYIYRVPLPFDLATLPAGATVTSAYIRVWLSAKTITSGSQSLVLSDSAQASLTALATSDWTLIDGSNLVSDDSHALTGLSTGAWVQFDLNAAGLAALTPGGSFKTCLRFASDFNNSGYPAAPGFGGGYNTWSATFHTSEGTNKPQLVITYTLPVTEKSGAETGAAADAASVVDTSAPIEKTAAETGAAADASSSRVFIGNDDEATGPGAYLFPPQEGAIFEGATATESASVSIPSEAVSKAGADTAASADAASVAAATPTAKTAAQTAAGSDAASVAEVQAPVVIQGGGYDLRLGRIRLPTLLDSLKETVGDQLETVGPSVVAGERRARPANLTVPVHATGSDGKAVADRMRRQLRALLDNPAARLGALHLAFTPDPELSGWLLIGAGDLEYDAGGVTVGDYKLTLADAYVVARERSHLQARRIEVADRRLATTPRDVKGVIYEGTWSAVSASPVCWLPGAAGYHVRGLPWPGTVALTLETLAGAGAPRLLAGVADGDIVAMAGLPDDEQLQLAELGDVVILDRQGVPATGVTAARDLTPQASYGWEELYGPNQPVSAPGDVVVQNGVCRVTLASSNGVIVVERMTSPGGFTAACTIQPLNDSSTTSLQLRDAALVEWTPDSAVLRVTLDNSQAGLSESAARCETFITLRRGWEGPRVECYLRQAGGGARCRLRVLPAVTGAGTVQFSDTSPAAITDDTSYGAFTSREPWASIAPPSGPGVFVLPATGATIARGRISASLRGLELYDPAAADVSYASVHLLIGTQLGSMSQINGMALLDARTIPTFLPR